MSPPLANLQLWLDHQPREAAMNMAIDEVLLHLAQQPVLRVYHWSQPSISLGYGQSLRALAPTLPPWPIVRRRTGGGAVWHDEHERTYSLIVPIVEPFARTRAIDSYRLIHEALAAALRLAGHPACRLAIPADTLSGANCFQAPALHDLLLDGQKIAGAGQRRTRHGLLHQGSLRHISQETRACGPSSPTPCLWQALATSLSSTPPSGFEPHAQLLNQALALASDTTRWQPLA